MVSLRPRWGRLLLLAPWFGEAMAGYLSVSVSNPVQCNNSVVTWSGDDGPYHLLLTPIDFYEHGYNLWISEISANLTNYTIPIYQPAGSSFLVTMWGQSGIRYAGTTDVQTVANSPSTSCFLTNDQILALYTFSFNITDTSDGYPAQCSNLTMKWPTSLESNVTGGGSTNTTTNSSTVVKRSSTTRIIPTKEEEKLLEEVESDEVPLTELGISLHQLDTSSSDQHGNTTQPPSIFGIIPLGNSFEIPITYSYNSKIAKSLPASSLSNTPTTWTAAGVTSLNWTIEMAKGTRFILVAGIGTNQQWASGGSSKMLTVGQGDTSCMGVQDSPTDTLPPPSVTGSSTSTATSSPQPADDGTTQNNGQNPVIKTAVSCVLSVVATLVIVGLMFFCRRRIRRRREFAMADPYLPGKAGDGAVSPSDDTPLDLLAADSRSTSNRHLTRLTVSPGPTSPTGSDPFKDDRSGFIVAERTYTTDDTGSHTPISPVRGGVPDILRAASMKRHDSGDALLRGTSSPVSPIEGSQTLPVGSSSRPLRVDTRTMGAGVEPETEGEEDEEDIPDLKRETLAYLGEGPGTSGSRGPPRRRRTDPAETEYVVHRDAGRVPPPQQPERRVLELPPRYEELHWEESEDRQTRTA